jgi:hypothetical protein
LAACTTSNMGNSVTRSPTPRVSPAETPSAKTCPVTEPAWLTPPDDAAVQGTPAAGYYFVNEDRSLWASAWGTDQEAEHHLRVSPEGIKVGWFRPAGATLEIRGQRIDVTQAPPLEAHIPCCYPTRFQATGLILPQAGCWEVVAQAAERELSFVVWVGP